MDRRLTDRPAGPGVGGLGSAAPPRPASPRYPCFDGFRFVAAFLVLLTHTSFISGLNFNATVGAYFARMDIGVSVFFLISGFLLYRPFVDANLSGGRAPELRRYFRRRFLRIFPAYWVALTAVLLVTTKSLHGIGEYVRHYGLVQIYREADILAGLTQAWSLATEITYYLFLPAYAAAVRAVTRRTARPVATEAVGLAVLFAVSVVFRTWVIESGRPIGVMGTWLPATTDLFALGMFLALASVHAARRPGGPGRWARAAGSAPALWWGAALVTFWVVSTRIGLPRDLAPMTYWQSMGRQFLYAAAAFLFLVPGIFGPQDRGAGRRALQLAPVQWLGLVSYGVYLWHELWIEKFFEWTGVAPFEGRFLLLTAFTAVWTVAVAAVSYVAVEKPALAWKERPHRRRRVAVGVPDGG